MQLLFHTPSYGNITQGQTSLLHLPRIAQAQPLQEVFPIPTLHLTSAHQDLSLVLGTTLPQPPLPSPTMRRSLESHHSNASGTDLHSVPISTNSSPCPK